MHDDVYKHRIDRKSRTGRVEVTTWPNTCPPSLAVRYRDNATGLFIEIIRADQTTFPYAWHFDVYRHYGLIGCGHATAQSASNVLFSLLRQESYYHYQRLVLLDLPPYIGVVHQRVFGRRLPNRHQRRREAARAAELSEWLGTRRVEWQPDPVGARDGND